LLAIEQSHFRARRVVIKADHFMKTKSLHRFFNRADHFQADIEIADIFALAVSKGALKSAESLFEHCDSEKHPTIAKRTVSEHNRMMASRHLSKTLCSAYIKDLYEDFSRYLAEIIESSARKGLSADRIIGDHKFAIDANELLKLGSWDAVIAYVSATLFRKIENEKSTIKLISAIDAKLDLKLDAAIRDAALPFLDLRHLLVHRDGVPDNEYCDKYQALGFTVGRQVSLNFKLVHGAKTAIHTLARHMDEKVVSLKLVSVNELQP
jgi:hypothetical protein